MIDPRTAERRDQTGCHQGSSLRGGRGRSLRWLALGVSIALVAAIAVYILRGRGEAGEGGPIAVLRTADFHSLAFRPDDNDVVFFGHHEGLMRSDDGGRTWRSIVQRPDFDVMGLAAIPGNPRQIYITGHYVFQTSTDGGASWQPMAHNLPDADIHGFAISPDDPRRLYAFVVRYGLFTSEDGGKNWDQVNDRLSQAIMALAAGSSDVLLAGTMGGGVLKSMNGGETWMPSNTGLDSASVTSLAMAPNRSTVYAGGDAGLYRSDDLGTNWRKLAFPGKSAIALAVSPSNPKLLLAIEYVRAGDGRLYRSEDGGATWGRRE